MQIFKQVDLFLIFLATGTNSITVSEVNGVATFPNLTIDQPGTGFSFQISSSDYSSISSSSFSVTGASKVYLSVGPGSTAPMQTAGVIELSITQKRASFS
ncbi:MAG: hypothetical protein HON90_16790 [Halobacteriovoraceae bacterium]|jgi:hypothetical protein|nr:hypothetical protein [Halobacteriovoraceae bacterium]